MKLSTQKLLLLGFPVLLLSCACTLPATAATQQIALQDHQANHTLFYQIPGSAYLLRIDPTENGLRYYQLGKVQGGIFVALEGRERTTDFKLFLQSLPPALATAIQYSLEHNLIYTGESTVSVAIPSQAITVQPTATATATPATIASAPAATAATTATTSTPETKPAPAATPPASTPPTVSTPPAAEPPATTTHNDSGSPPTHSPAAGAPENPGQLPTPPTPPTAGSTQENNSSNANATTGTTHHDSPTTTNNSNHDTATHHSNSST